MRIDLTVGVLTIVVQFLAERAGELRDSDIYTLRRITPEDAQAAHEVTMAGAGGNTWIYNADGSLRETRDNGDRPSPNFPKVWVST